MAEIITMQHHCILLEDNRRGSRMRESSCSVGYTDLPLNKKHWAHYEILNMTKKASEQLKSYIKWEQENISATGLLCSKHLQDSRKHAEANNWPSCELFQGKMKAMDTCFLPALMKGKKARVT